MASFVEDIGVFTGICKSLVLEPVWERKLRQEALVKRLMSSVTGRISKENVEKILALEPARDDSPQTVIKQAKLRVDESVIVEVMNYRNVSVYVEQIVSMRSKNLEKVDLLKELSNIHSLASERIITSTSLGVYREVEVESEVSPLAVELPYQMEDFGYFLAKGGQVKIHPLFRLGVMFYELLRLQPFTYANRRTIYAFLRLNMLLAGYDNKRLLCLEEGWERDVAEFNELMERGFLNQDITEFMELFLEDVADKMKEMGETLGRLGTGEVKKVRGRQVALSNRQISLIEELEIKGELTMSAARKLLPEVSDDTILRDLKDLMDKKIVVKKGKTKGAKYLLRK